jgi:hypothetical protein
MRILVLNPNFSESITERLVATARKAATLGVVIGSATAPRGVPRRCLSAFVRGVADSLFSPSIDMVHVPWVAVLQRRQVRFVDMGADLSGCRSWP